ncbi:MAG: hypothetical protein LAP13_06160 [Acidobacteriia bacterium]|nr:hypothetical protein [Terriglobia bacterium]
MHPLDLALRNIREGTLVRVFNERGIMVVRVCVSDSTHAGIVMDIPRPVGFQDAGKGFGECAHLRRYQRPGRRRGLPGRAGAGDTAVQPAPTNAYPGRFLGPQSMDSPQRCGDPQM